MSILSTTSLGALTSVVLAAIALSPSPCHAAPPSPVTDPTISIEYAQINDAILHHDVDKIMSYCTQDFTEVSSTGAIVDRDQERKQYESEFSRIKSMAIHYSIQNCDSSPSQISCDVRFHMDGIGFKRVLFMKLEGAFSNDLQVHDVWVSTPDGLRLKSRQCLLDETKIASE